MPDTSEERVWNALDVNSRYHLAAVAGPGNHETAREVITIVYHYSHGLPPLFITDGLASYVEAITGVYTRPRDAFASEKLHQQFTYHGIQEKLHLESPAIWHLRVIKQPSQLQDEFTDFPTLQLVINGQKSDIRVLNDLSFSISTSTSYVERRQFTQRRRCAVLQRKSSAVTQERSHLQNQVTLERFSYNYCQPHRSLREYRPSGCKLWQPVTPAMKLGVTDHVWTLEKALSFSIQRSPHGKRRAIPALDSPLPEPSVIELQLKDNRDWKILKCLHDSSDSGLTSLELCQRISIPRTTIHDRLCILEAKTLVTRYQVSDKKRGHPRTLFRFNWTNLSLNHAKKRGTGVLVSDVS